MKKFLLSLFCMFTSFLVYGQSDKYSYGAWAQVPEILARIVPPSFPDVDYNIIDYGAVSGGTVKCTSAIQKAVNACSSSNGGRVVIPRGTFLTGAIHLKSNVNLHLSEGAVLLFSSDLNDYLPNVLTRFEGMECYNYSPFIYAYGQTDIAITGSGTLDGNTANESRWNAWKSAEKRSGSGRNILIDMTEKNIPVEDRIFGEDIEASRLRPVFIQPYKCKNILIEGIKIRNSPMWEINPVLCENITVKDLDINTHWHNNDGCNPESSKDVLIEDCVFDTGDDCIAIKSGRNNDGRRINIPSENIIIRGCTMKDGHGGVVLGSELSGGIRNVFIEDCIMNSADLDRALRIKTNWTRGAFASNVYMRNCVVEKVAGEFLQVDMTYEEGHAGGFKPTVENIQIENVTVNSCPKIFTLICYDDSPVSDVILNNCTFNNSTKTGTLQNVRKIQLNGTTLNGTNPLLPDSGKKPSSGFSHAEIYESQVGWGWSNIVPAYTGNGYMEVMTGSGKNAIVYAVPGGPLKQDERHTLTLRYFNRNMTGIPHSIVVYAKDETGIYSDNHIGSVVVPQNREWNTVSFDIDLPESTSGIVLVSMSGIGIDEYKTVFKEIIPSSVKQIYTKKKITIPTKLTPGFYIVSLQDKKDPRNKSDVKIIVSDADLQKTTISVPMEGESFTYGIYNFCGIKIAEGTTE